jgi:hypothetical protein
MVGARHGPQSRHISSDATGPIRGEMKRTALHHGI